MFIFAARSCAAQRDFLKSGFLPAGIQTCRRAKTILPSRSQFWRSSPRRKQFGANSTKSFGRSRQIRRAQQWRRCRLEKKQISLPRQVLGSCSHSWRARAFNVHRDFFTDELTGDKEFWEYGRQDWLFLILFWGIEGVILLCLVCVAAKAGKISARRDRQIADHCKTCHAAIASSERLAAEWFDFSRRQRATITQNGKAFFSTGRRL